MPYEPICLQEASLGAGQPNKLAVLLLLGLVESSRGKVKTSRGMEECDGGVITRSTHWL